MSLSHPNPFSQCSPAPRTSASDRLAPERASGQCSTFHHVPGSWGHTETCIPQGRQSGLPLDSSGPLSDRTTHRTHDEPVVGLRHAVGDGPFVIINCPALCSGQP